MKFYELAWSFFRKMLQMRSRFATTCTTTGTRGAKLPVDATSSGRSMVEMLGVLAIIGVLSVGAIAGYSKAMMKYKLNKQAEQLNQVISTALRYAGQWNSSELMELIPVYVKLGEIPQEMIKGNNANVIYDVFNTQIAANYTPSSNISQMFIFLNPSSRYNADICYNVMNIAKEYHGQIRTLDIYGTEGDVTASAAYKGDMFDASPEQYIRNLTVEEISKACQDNVTENKHIKIYWDG